ncbi:glycoside hydrolase family 5 protein [Tabrizicola flagellatus]|uniref:glycoside hydrolase family 5 protein n=1 Tax=Tabrizicola flagellatus TaxID=2593021 RepID=UPI00135C9C1E|nr:cellulase family glycosylhydrolase [Tabrizicola flagellatus]
MLTHLSARLAPALALLGLAFPALAEPPKLSKGIATDIWVEWHRVGEYLADPALRSPYPDWPQHVSDARLAQLRAEGFDFVRMPVDPEPMLLLDPGPTRDAMIAEIVARVRQLHAAGLTVIVDLHTIPRSESGGIDRIVGNPGTWAFYLDLVDAVGRALTDAGLDPARTLFEPINEPTNDCTAIWEGKGPAAWPAMLAEMHAVARAAAPDLTLVLSGACWGGVEGLEALDPAAIADDNVIWSFHSYQPYTFTHQGADWSEDRVAFLSDLPYPPSRLKPEALEPLADAAVARAAEAWQWFARDFTRQDYVAALEEYRSLPEDFGVQEIQRAAAWAKAHGIPTSRLLMGEFGTIGGQDSKARVRAEDRWQLLADKRRAAEEVGIAWSVWSWISDFGIATGPDRTIDPGACAALGLTGCAAPTGN